ncbi:MAG: PRC-barrel domain-containing protein [Rhizobiaceae bacterium]|nr:PRC-barrel domain-containing protein [Rhizobiaceae bacterium]MCV0408362.1 PRC-barrel domain-containing protein [Rhizobiaceae bacterium]
MIRNLLATTALATLVATGAYAQTTTTQPTAPAAAPETPRVIKAEGNLASNIIGATVYNGTGDDAENIGEVKDIVLGPEGDIQAIVVGVGGFLGIGQKNVALEYDVIEWTEQDGERWLVVQTTEEALKAQPDFDRQAYEPMPADADVAEVKPASKEDLDNAPVEADAEGGEPADDTAMAPADDAGDDTAMAPADDAGEDSAAAPADDATEDTAAAPADDATEDTAAAPADDATEDTAAAPADDATEDTAAAPADDATEDTAAAPADDATEDTAAAPADDATEDTAAAPADEEMGADDAMAESADEEAQDGDMTAQAPAADTDAAGTDDETTGAIDRSSLQPLDAAALTAEELIGTRVYGANDEDVGEVGDVVMDGDKVDAIIIDVGGFLGIGEKQVAVGMDNLEFMSDGDGNNYLYTQFTQEQLEQQPEYDEAGWAENRDEMRMVVPDRG